MKKIRRLSKTERKTAMRRAKHLPAYMQSVAFSLTGAGKRIQGTFGPASPVRHVDPSEYPLAAEDPK